MKKTMALLLLAAVAAPVSAGAAEGSIYADVLSTYVYNGLQYNDEAVFQPGLDVAGPFGFGYGLWANMDLTDNPASTAPNTSGEWSEVDLSLTWAAPAMGPVGLSVGGLYYVYPQSSSVVATNAEGAVESVSTAPADGSYQVFAKAAADLPLAPAVKFCHELDNTDDWIVLFTVGHGFDLMDKLALNLGAVLGFAGDYYVESNYGSGTGAVFTHAQFDAALSYALTDKASVALKGSFSTLLDGDLRDDVDAAGVYADQDVFFGGVNASYSF